ncbi:hypothetical protein AcV5_004218 [Taiwanofungus camphoratus]|nr:hypothetical protein AcW2_001188 [Antrodia cinnamomea]KAI0935943.1 hypothetical protein AcV5_004218 [Antrodia cinnamomea]KAI0961162.1 hypothetical protein AcV7_000336 [Antrodia cinnamomea]
MCQSAPTTMETNSCVVLWGGDSSNNATMSDLESQYAMADSSSVSSSSMSSAVSSSVASIASVSIAFGSINSSVVSSSLSLSPPASLVPSSSGFASFQTKLGSVSEPTATTVSEPQKSTQANLAFSTRTVTVTLQAMPTQDADFIGGGDDYEEPDGDAGHDDGDNGTIHARRGHAIVLQPLQVNGHSELKVDGLSGTSEVTLDHTCLVVLNWPVSILDNTKREDIAFMMFQFWLLAMSFVALLNESIPHIIASLLTHILATAWGGFQIANTAQFHNNFTRLTTNGACGVNLLPTYWKSRSDAEIPSLVLNGVALLFSAFLSWKLIKAFGWQTFKRVGASRTINRIYNVVLLLSIAIQLALFFIAVSGALWLDQLINGYIGHLTSRGTLFKAIIIVVLVLLVPWLATGWISVRREYNVPMLGFLLVGLGYLAGWASMFAAATFRWTFVQWRFFSVMASASVLLAFITLVLGIICRFNFGKGLPRYLNAQEPLPSDDFLPTAKDIEGNLADVEKADFPSTDLPIPTFSATFPAGSSAPFPSERQFVPRQLGPRFFSPSLTPFDPQPDLPAYSTQPNPTFSSVSRIIVSDSHSLHQSESTSESGTSSSTMDSKRWVIE